MFSKPASWATLSNCGRCKNFMGRALAAMTRPSSSAMTLFAQGKDFFAVVGDVEDGYLMTPFQARRSSSNLRLGYGVQRGQRLVEQQAPGPRHQGSRQRDPLPLPAGNLAGAALGAQGLRYETIAGFRGTA